MKMKRLTDLRPISLREKPACVHMAGSAPATPILVDAPFDLIVLRCPNAERDDVGLVSLTLDDCE